MNSLTSFSIYTNLRPKIEHNFVRSSSGLVSIVVTALSVLLRHPFLHQPHCNNTHIVTETPPNFYQNLQQESPPIGGAVRNATSLIPQRLSYIMLAITCSENVRALPCIESHWRIDRDNNTTPANHVTRKRR